MDLTKLLSFLNQKGFHYFEGNQYNNVITIELTTAYHGRGSAVEIRIDDKLCGVHIQLQQAAPTPPIEHELYDITEEQVYIFLNQHLSLKS